MEWELIDTAPKDGTVVLVWCKGEIEPCPAGFASREHFEKEYGDPEYMEEGWYPSYGFMFDLPEVVIYPIYWTPLVNPFKSET